MIALIFSTLLLGAEAPEGAAPPPDSTPTLSLPLVLEEALRDNQDLRSFEPARSAALDRATAAGAFPHPTLGFAVRSLPVPSLSFSEDEMTSADVMVRQRFPWFGKRGLREEAGAKEAEVLTSQRDAQALSVVEEAVEAYAALWLADQWEEVLKGQQGAMARLVQLARQGISTGTRGQSDLILAETEAARLEDLLLQARREQMQARAWLAGILSSEEPLVGRPAPPPTQPLPPLDGLLASLESHPELLALSKERERYELDARLARREKLPDVEVGLSYGVRTDHPDMVGVEVAFPIPLFASSKEDRLAAAAQAEARATTARRQGRRDALGAGVRRAWAAAKTEADRLRLYEDEILPRIRRNVEASASGYLAGRVDFYTVVDAQVQVFLNEIESIRAKANYTVAMARLASASGDMGLVVQGAEGVRDE